MSKLSLSAIALATSLAGGAFAETADFTGYSVGGSIGFGKFEGNQFANGALADDATNEPTFALQFGYNHALQSDWVIGVQAGVQALGDANSTDFADKNVFDIDDTQIFSVRGVVGKAVTPEIFTYSAIGYENWGVDYFAFDPSPAPDETGTERLQGYSLGLGLEYLVADRQTIGAEIKYTEFDRSESYGVFDTSIAPVVTQLIVSYNYRF